MGMFTKLSDSADRMNGMADRLDFSFTAKIQENPEIEAYRYRSAIYKCASCACAEACDTLQAENAHLDAAPAYCRNRTLFAEG